MTQNKLLLRNFIGEERRWFHLSELLLSDEIEEDIGVALNLFHGRYWIENDKAFIYFRNPETNQLCFTSENYFVELSEDMNVKVTTIEGDHKLFQIYENGLVVFEHEYFQDRIWDRTMTWLIPDDFDIFLKLEFLINNECSYQDRVLTDPPEMV